LEVVEQPAADAAVDYFRGDCLVEKSEDLLGSLWLVGRAEGVPGRSEGVRGRCRVGWGLDLVPVGGRRWLVFENPAGSRLARPQCTHNWEPAEYRSEEREEAGDPGEGEAVLALLEAYVYRVHVSPDQQGNPDQFHGMLRRDRRGSESVGGRLISTPM
jgi:hypothetical protein